MCEFCLKHGEGRKWYLQAANYAEDMLSDIRRREFLARVIQDPRVLTDKYELLKRVDRLPSLVRRAVSRRATARMKQEHFGQVIPIEDVERILDFVTSVVRVDCMCRNYTLGGEHRYCYGLSMGPEGGTLVDIARDVRPHYFQGPNSVGVETLSKPDALAQLRELEREGVIHTVWTFRTPFIAGLCNCARMDCLAMRVTQQHATKMFFRAEYVAVSDQDACVGCQACMRVCPFDALVYSAAHRKVQVEPRMCYGCGICRSVCPKGVLTLMDRADHPDVAHVW